MKAGQQVLFRAPAYPGQTFKAPIRRVSREADQSTRTMRVELDVLNRDAKVSPGSFTTVPGRSNGPRLRFSFLLQQSLPINNTPS